MKQINEMELLSGDDLHEEVMSSGSLEEAIELMAEYAAHDEEVNKLKVEN